MVFSVIYIYFWWRNNSFKSKQFLYRVEEEYHVRHVSFDPLLRKYTNMYVLSRGHCEYVWHTHTHTFGEMNVGWNWSAFWSFPNSRIEFSLNDNKRLDFVGCVCACVCVWVIMVVCLCYVQKNWLVNILNIYTFFVSSLGQLNIWGFFVKPVVHMMLHIYTIWWMYKIYIILSLTLLDCLIQTICMYVYVNLNLFLPNWVIEYFLT